jgi:hypothetical protein
MNDELFVELIETIEKYLGGRVTDCGAELNEECNEINCNHYYECRRNYEFDDRLEDLKRRASIKIS